MKRLPPDIIKLLGRSFLDGENVNDLSSHAGIRGRERFFGIFMKKII